MTTSCFSNGREGVGGFQVKTTPNRLPLNQVNFETLTSSFLPRDYRGSSITGLFGEIGE
jgi:hypothetical protein